MAVVIETTLGDFTVDLFTDSRPQACKNFLKLCKMKYYHFCLFHSVQPNFLAQTGDPLGTGSGGESIYGLLYGDNARYFEAEVMPKIKHYKPGLLSMVNCGNNMLGSQFFITLGEDLVSLDGEHCVFGEITEGTEIIHKLNEAICDTLHRPYKDIRITHTVILEDPFEDPSGLKAPDTSPEPTQEKLANGRIGADEEIDETAGLTAAEVEERRQEREAKARATILEIVGDLPDADVAPPENVLFVCKLNPVTTDEDLEIIFNRFGKVMSCEVIRDKNTGDSLQYAFVEFDDQKACEEAYFKMDNVLIDDRRIHVDFSQSTAKERNIRWRGKGKGIEYLDQQDRVKDSKLRDKSREESRNHSSSSNRRDKDHAERDRHKERIREREDERQTKGERGREKDGDSRERRRRERDCSRSDYRKRDGKHRRDNHRDDNKRYDKRRETENIRKRESDLKKSSGGGSSRKSDKRSEDRRDDDCKREDKRLKKEVSSGNRHTDFDKIENLEKLDFKEKKLCRNLTTGQICKEESDLKSSQKTNESNQQMPCVISQPQNVKIGITDDQEFPESSEVNKRLIEEEEGDKKEQIESDHSTEDKISHKSDKTNDEQRLELKKRSSKRKRKVSQNRKRKKGRYSSSSESSSDSSDSSESSSSSDSSDYKHSKKKKLIIAKKYYRGGKLVKEVKKKKRTKVSSDSDSISDESSDSEHKKKRKLKKQKKSSNHVKPPRKSVTSSDDSHSETSSSDSSDVRNKKSKRKSCEKQIKKKSKHSSSKKRKRRKEASSSSDSDISVKNKAVSKK